MTRPIAMARFDLAWPLAGACAAVLSALVLGAWAAARGMPVWMPLNATTHALHGPAAASTTALDLSHTGLGAAIHVASCFFWAAVAIWLVRRVPRGGAGLAWLAGLATAAMAGLVDYGLMPARLRPGWELVLPPLGVATGLAALGVGLSLGMIAAGAIGRRLPGTAAGRDRYPSAPRPAEPPLSAVERLRHPAPHVLDQRQQRVDPAGAVTEDPNRHGSGDKQPGDPTHDERPDR
ncbi:hypothetical protein [Paracoccus denitrificans]|jgi:hypothetical protein|nr:hypothetical protein [Paracoccus denitrificans]MBB4629104.1 hypothetical protein [Paracoccus denitrificans]MCU7431044.1 hypothetical protein [Paracoccus denitrificans]UPV96221.1 hypothetical protein M0K93_06490 [Paracoccus denitrificans]WQO34412.1 hypothetical protein U0005_04960 [Paracoccus denitrificans]SDJ31258.1 hypothetical protein SAMN04244581_03666 [Paracoccus denitrificans]